MHWLTTLSVFEFFGIRTFPQPVENSKNQKVNFLRKFKNLKNLKS